MIGILTYIKPHRRSQDLILNMHKDHSICVIALPWKNIKQKQTLLNIAKPEPLNITQKELCSSLGIEYYTANSFPKCSWYLIGGAQILGTPFTQGNTLNVHPGVLEHVRGLDSLKRSLLYGYPIGASLHIINENIDGGKLLQTRLIAKKPTDTLDSLTTKLYNLEQEILVEAVEIAESGDFEHKSIEMVNATVWKTRMTHEEELNLYLKLKSY